MRLTIIRETNHVAIDGVTFEVDCSALPADVHAVQWDGSGGEVEYSVTRCTHCGARSKKGNELITHVLAYQPLIDAWAVARATAEKEVTEREAAHRATGGGAHVAGPQG